MYHARFDFINIMIPKNRKMRYKLNFVLLENAKV